GNVNLQAAENTSSQHSTNSGSSASAGVSFTVGDKSGIAFTAGVAGNRGNADGDSSTWTNTHVSAGNELAIQSGGDTNLKGAVASGKQVVADVGGNLNIESLQDKDHYDSKQQSAGISASVCAPPLCTGKSSVAGSVGQTKMNSDYASVIEQSGIKAGDGGFQVDVKGNTDLKGGVVASSDKAVQDNL
ncbi:hemagglutinin repeat-containing protein, partial [Burkholderia gladioli]